jgi:SAM-dependent methyltransferase
VSHAGPVQELLAHLDNHYPIYSKSIRASRARNQKSFDELGSFLLSAIGPSLNGQTVETLADGYAFFLEEVNRAQHLYEKAGRYEYSSYREVFHQTYDNDQFMGKYHWGVLAITFLWEHHLRIFDFFKDRFLGTYLEKDCTLADFGSGAGVWSLIASHWRPDVRVTGVDISKSSFDLANRLAQAVGVGERVHFVVGDALSGVDVLDACDGCISCFLMEHLEQPQLLLENLARHLAPGKFAFVTTAITAAEVDHIYEFKNESEVVAMAEASGFRLVEMLSSSPPIRRLDLRYLPRSVAMILQRKHNELW